MQTIKSYTFTEDERQLIIDALSIHRWKFTDHLLDDRINAIKSMMTIEDIIDTLKK